MSDRNPYAPPSSEVLGAVLLGDPESYWIEGSRLHIKDGGSLPEVCLQTGKVSDEMARLNAPFTWAPRWANWLIFPILILAWWIEASLLTVGFLGAWVLLLQKVQRICTIGISVLQSAVKSATRFKYLQLLIVFGIIVKVMFLEFSIEVRFLIMITILMGGKVLLNLVFRGIRLARIEDGVAILSEVHPDALVYLAQWREEGTGQGDPAKDF